MTSEELTAPELTPEQITIEQKAHYIKNRVPVNWRAFDAETAKVLEPLARSIYDGCAREDVRPGRVSEKLIYREGHRLENMPLCRAIMQKYYETYEQNWARRLIWAYRKLKCEYGDKPIFWVALRRVSGVKERNLARVIPIIHNYADSETTEAIINLVTRLRGYEQSPPHQAETQHEGETANNCCRTRQCSPSYKKFYSSPTKTNEDNMRMCGIESIYQAER